MKIRTGFVSNSSSSSFIIRFEKGDNDQYSCIYHLNKLISNYCDDEEAEVFTLNRLRTEFDWFEEEEFKKLEEYLEAGDTLIEVEVSNHNEERRELIQEYDVVHREYM